LSSTPRRQNAPAPRRVTGTTRPGRTVRSSSFFDRNRTLLLAALAIVAVVGVGAVAFSAATSPAYACTAQWQPEVTPPPAPSATPRLGYVQTQLERTHVQPGDFVRYPFCPPASGKHVNAQGAGPISAKVYGPDDKAVPQGWIHNLEHGGLVLLYRCTGGDACTDAGQEALRAFVAAFPPSPVCNLPSGNGQLSPVVVRFEEMAFPYAALLWGQVLPLQTLDTNSILAFWAQQGERSNPEKLCAAPTPTPAPTGTPGPTGTPAASPTPSSGASATPEPSPAAS
jgi:hypothetical protein